MLQYKKKIEYFYEIRDTKSTLIMQHIYLKTYILIFSVTVDFKKKNTTYQLCLS